MSISEDELARYRANQAAARARPHPRPAALKKPGRSRFARSKPEDRTWGGVTYASKGEMELAKQLERERLKKPGIWWVRQPVFDLAGVQYRPDFLVVRPANVLVPTGNDFEFFLNPRSAVTVYEIKPALKPGRFRDEALRTFRRNQAQVQALWGITVELIEL